jgi:hypothetical protein
MFNPLADRAEALRFSRVVPMKAQNRKAFSKEKTLRLPFACCVTTRDGWWPIRSSRVPNLLGGIAGRGVTIAQSAIAADTERGIPDSTGHR